MKFMNSRFTALFATLALCTGMAMAQDETAPPAAGPKGHAMHGHFMRGGEFGLPLRELNLTDDQKTQIKQIFQNEKTAMKPLMQQAFASRKQMMDLVTSDKFDEATAAKIATQESQLHARLEVEHAKIASQIYQLLSSDQKSKVAEIKAQHEQRMQQHMMNHEQAAPQNDQQ
ncbi:MAG TPA: Spy/CpxP family protein refolding chaperone [Terriglobales bacterium]|nr:Spy/CpxP family protein refolding chaperone [Terriglobales bacterium]